MTIVAQPRMNANGGAGPLSLDGLASARRIVDRREEAYARHTNLD
jgi:hypothetical protein